MSTEEGIYVSLDELLSLQEHARYIADSLSAVTRNMLQGNRPSKMHGRGGAFDQIRNYLAGDDVRNIDWNVTARMGKPFVRVFNEERETPLLILADQSANMFFATRKQMKSVVAARVAAYLLWMSHSRRRPCGGVVFGDDDHALFRPKGDRTHLYGMLDRMVRYNRQLSKESLGRSRGEQFAAALAQLNRIAPKDAYVILISDFTLINEACWQLIERLRLRTNLIATPIHDGLIADLPSEGQFLARYANLEAELDFSSYASRKKISRSTQDRIDRLNHRLAELGIPVLLFSTYQDVERQLASGLFVEGGQNA